MKREIPDRIKIAFQNSLENDKIPIDLMTVVVWILRQMDIDDLSWVRVETALIKVPE